MNVSLININKSRASLYSLCKINSIFKATALSFTALALSACDGGSQSSSTATSQLPSSAANSSSAQSSLAVSSQVSSQFQSSSLAQTSSTQSSLPSQNAPADLTGFATYSAMSVSTTTGGAGGREVVVTTYNELVQYASTDEPLIIKIQGTVSGPDTGYEKVRVASNKSIIGIGDDATLSEIGLVVRATEGCSDAFNENVNYVSNVIIRNIHFTNVFDYKPSPDPDGVTIECFSHHVWVDHNSFIYPANKADQGKTDGALDIKRGANFVTVSWNHFYHYNKTALVGHNDGNDLQDSGRLHVTYHHNYFENTQQRHPRVRFGKVHMFNNYMFNDKTGPTGSQVSYYTLAGPESELYIEGNNILVNSGELYVVSEDSDSSAKVTVTGDNIVELYNPNAEVLYQVNTGTAFNPSDYYDYNAWLTPPDELRTYVPDNVGAGKIAL